MPKPVISVNRPDKSSSAVSKVRSARRCCTGNYIIIPPRRNLPSAKLSSTPGAAARRCSA